MSYVSIECDKSQRGEVPDSQLSSQVLQRPRGWGQKVIPTKELTGGICQADSSASEMVWAHGWMSLSWPLLWSHFCRQRGIKGQIYCRSPLSSCFLLLPCLTSLRRAGLWTWLNRCLRQVILFPLIVLSNSRADWKVILCTCRDTLSCVYSITSWHCLTVMPSSAFSGFGIFKFWILVVSELKKHNTAQNLNTGSLPSLLLLEVNWGWRLPGSWENLG